MTDAIQGCWMDREPTTDRKTQRALLKESRWNANMNAVYCLGAAGKLFYAICRAEIGADGDIAIITGVKRSKLLAMRNGDVSLFTLDDLQAAVQACYWQLFTCANQYGFAVLFALPGKQHRDNGHWRDDDEIIKAEIKRRAADNSPKVYY